MQEFIDPYSLNNRQFLIKAEHLMRYWLARDFLNKVVPRQELGTKSKTIVFDFACGNGYGSNILSETAGKVIGADKNKALIEEAERKHGLNKKVEFYNIDLETTDFAAWMEENGISQPDAVVSFETLEHFDIPETFITSMAELLPQDGYFICSVPNSKYDTDKNGLPKDKYHKQLFSKKDIADMLHNSGFITHAVYGQPISNFVAEHSRAFSGFLNKFVSPPQSRFESLAKIIAYPTKYFVNYSYSYIFIAQKRNSLQ